MQGVMMTFVLILSLVSPCLCVWFDNNVVEPNNTYNVMDFGAVGDGKADDSLAILNVWKQACGAQQTAKVLVPANKVFSVTNVILTGPCNATTIHVQIQGTIMARGKDGSLQKSSAIVLITNVNGLTLDGGGIIDGQGSTWWPTCRMDCPTALRFHACNNLRVSDLKVSNSPEGHISVNSCNGATFSHITVQAPANSPNTDGFDISVSKNIFIQDSHIATGDDCIAINSGSSFINVTGVTCGPGHGISIGSLGRRNNVFETVEVVYVRNCSFIGTQNGARIKTFKGGSGYARKITFEHIILQGVRNPILINQNYIDASGNTNSDVEVSEVTYRDFRGTSMDDKAINLDCSPLGCFKLLFDQINIISSVPGRNTFAICRNAHGTVIGPSVPNVTCLLR